MARPSWPALVFCCYAREDEMWLRKLETHLSPLVRQGLISLWHNRCVAAGANWTTEADTHLEMATVILLLVSADFFASDYCYSIEMKRALSRQEAGEARVVPILVRPVDWKAAPFAHLSVLPTDAKPLASWQDEDRALADITAGIRRVIVEELPRLTASAPRAARPSIWNIPYPRNPFFLGRESELVQIRQKLQADQATAHAPPLAISGLGGIGKTQIAVEYAYRAQQDYHAVLWTLADTRESLISGYVSLASLLNLREREEQNQLITVQAVVRWLATHQSWLLILDNADDLSLVQDFLPPHFAGHLLLTTPAQAGGRLARRIQIEILSPSHGSLLLLRRAALLEADAPLEQAREMEVVEAMEICAELGGLPLALDQAGAYLEETGISLAGYRQLYQQDRAQLLSERGGVVPDHPEPVATTWSLSFKQVGEHNRAAADLLQLLAWLPADGIPEEFLEAGALFLGPELGPVAANGMLLNQAISVLRAYSLIQRDPRALTLSVHRLVQAVLQDRQTEEQQRTWKERGVRAVSAAFPRADFERWSQCERLLPLALLAAEYIEGEQMRDLPAAGLLHETASYLCDRMRYLEAKPLYQQALKIREQSLGGLHPDVAYSLLGLAELSYEQGRYQEAGPLYERALAIFEQSLGGLHPDVASLLLRLAELYWEQGRSDEAEQIYERTLAIFEQVEPQQLDMVYPLGNLAKPYCEQKRYAEAERLYLRALAIFERLGEAHPNVAASLQGLANLYGDQEKYREAETLHRRALHIMEQHFGETHPEVACPLYDLAELYREQGRYAEAEQIYERALHILEQQLGEAHHYVAYFLLGLANISCHQGNRDRAERLYERALSLREQRLGSEHPLTAETLHHLAAREEEWGNCKLALSLYQRSLIIREQVLGESHKRTRETFLALQQLLSQGDNLPEKEMHP